MTYKNINHFPLSLDWLLLGRGSMFRSEGVVDNVSQRSNSNMSVRGSGSVKVQQQEHAAALQKCKQEVERLHERLKEANETAKTAMEAVKMLAQKNNS